MKILSRPTTYVLAFAAALYGAALVYQPGTAGETRTGSDNPARLAAGAARDGTAAATCPSSAWPYVAAECLSPVGVSSPRQAVRVVRPDRGEEQRRVRESMHEAAAY